MLDILDSYLAVATAPEQHEQLRLAHEALYKVGRNDIDSYCESLMMTDGDRDSGETIQLIIQGTQSLLHEALINHGVTLSGETPTELLVQVLDVLLALPNYENKEELLSVVLAEQSPGQTFAEIAGIVGCIKIDQLMTYITEVASSLIKRITEILTAQEENVVDEEELLIRKRHADALRYFCGFIGKDKLEIALMIRNGMPLGYPFTVYAGYIGRRFETFPIEQLAHELYAIALCSIDGINNPRAIIQRNINNYIANTTVITKVDIIVSDLLIKLNR